MSAQFVTRLAFGSVKAATLAKRCVLRMLDPQPSTLRYPSQITQSAYYSSTSLQNEVEIVSKFMLMNNISLENTRLVKTKTTTNKPEFVILQASIEEDSVPKTLGILTELEEAPVTLIRGDHSKDLSRVSAALSQAEQYCASEHQQEILQALQKSFQTGKIDDYKMALTSWVKDKDPTVDHVLGFVEQYRDPHGTRAEFAGIVAIQDKKESATLRQLVESSQTFIKTLPWIQGGCEDTGNGPFETDLFEAPSFTSLHTTKYS